MLKLHFINVADGDAIYVEELYGPRPFRLLVDAGLPQVKPEPGSARVSCASYLRDLGVRHIDVLVITHLHLDHFGGVQTLLEQVSVDRVYAGYLPPHPERHLAPQSDAVKTLRGQAECLNLWCETVQRLERAGCKLHPVGQSETLSLTDRLTAELVVPNEGVWTFQKQVWDDLLDGRRVPDDLAYLASKSRNPGSLRLRLAYAGRRVELTGDCYGAMWDREPLKPCDILKVPHHGDGKAVTETLVRKLRPAHAVISCASQYIPHKDRPSARTAELLAAQGTRLWYTDSFSMPGCSPVHWPAAVFCIAQDGTILPPLPSTESGKEI